GPGMAGFCCAIVHTVSSTRESHLRTRLAHYLATCRGSESSYVLGIPGELKADQRRVSGCKPMGTDPIIAPQCDSYRYEAVVRISEAIAACREPEELARTLADEIGNLLQFDHLYFFVFKENSKEIEYHVWGKGPISSLPDLPM